MNRETFKKVHAVDRDISTNENLCVDCGMKVGDIRNEYIVSVDEVDDFVWKINNSWRSNIYVHVRCRDLAAAEVMES